LADDTLARLAESRQFIGLRDATGDMARPRRLQPLLPPGFRLLSGDDDATLGFLVNGGGGCISATSNVAPLLCQAMFASCGQERLQSARYLQNRLAPLTAALAQDNPAAMKYALFLLGLMRPNTRLPIVELADAAKAQVESAVAGIRDQEAAWPSERWARLRSHVGSVAVP